MSIKHVFQSNEFAAKCQCRNKKSRHKYAPGFINWMSSVFSMFIEFLVDGKEF